MLPAAESNFELTQNYVGGEGKKVLTSLMDPERGPQETVKSTLGCGHLHKDVNHAVIL